MTFVTLDPASTGSNSGAVTGSNAHSALSDGSDATYVDYDYGESSILGLSDLSLPSGAVLVSAQVLARASKQATGPAALNTVLVADVTKQLLTSVTADAASEYGGAFAWGGLTDAGLDGANVGIYSSGLSQLRVFKAWVRVFYLTKPSVSVDTPTGTIARNTFAVTWTPSFDVHGDTNHFYEIKVFSAAQYGAGGFNPSLSSATVSASGRSSLTNRYFSEGLPNGAYRAYVRVAAGNSSDQWSDWDYESFTVSVPAPAVPSLSLTPSSSQGGIDVQLVSGGGTVVTDYFEIQRSLDGVDFVEVRTGFGGGSVAYGGTVTAFDYEAPNGGSVIYRARSYAGGTPAYSDWVLGSSVWSSDSWWLKHPYRPSLNREINLVSYPGRESVANQGVFRPLGSSRAVVVSDVRGPDSGEIVVLTDSLASRVELAELLADQSPVLLHGPVSHEVPERWVAFGDLGSERLVDGGRFPEELETLPWTEVDRPSGPLEE